MAIEFNEILESFVAEATDGLADVENDLLALEAGGSEIDADLINKLFRNIHSIKGTAGFCGLRAIGELAHEMENVLNLVRNRELVPTGRIVEQLLRCADMLARMVADVATSNDVDVGGHAADLKQALAAEQSGADAGPPREIDVCYPGGMVAFLMIPEPELVARQKRGMSIHILDVDLVEHVERRGADPLAFLHQLYEHGEIVASYLSTAGLGTLEDPVPDRIGFTVLYASARPIAALADALALPVDCIATVAGPDACRWEPDGPCVPNAAAPAATTNDGLASAAAAGPATPAEAPAPVARAAPASPRATSESTGTPSPHAATAASSLRVNVRILDALMTLAGELVLARNQLLQVQDGGDASSLGAVATKIDRITSDLQETIMQTRMQPIGSVFSKFPRVVRDLSQQLGKQCEIEIEGKDVELDKSIVEAISDPLTHLVRNAVDHGVESPERRAEAGKDPVGRVELRAFHRAGKVIISIADDGGGIDPARLRRKAVEKGIMGAEAAAELSDRDAVRLIFHPGFSTAEKVTDVSGRGVGMDVVRTNIESLGGTVDIETEIGRGSTFNIALPLTLAIIPSLVVRTGGRRFAVPQSNISELIRVGAEEIRERIRRVKGVEVLRLRGALLPLTRLSSALGIATSWLDDDGRPHPNARVTLADRRDDDEPSVVPGERRAGATDRRGDSRAGALNIVVLETGAVRYGLVVDALEDSQEIVVKPLGRHLRGCSGLAGATILGDGTVALILDAAGVAAVAQIASNLDAESARERADVPGSGDDRQSILVFENHPSERFAVPSALIARIERVESRRIEAVGGVEVLPYRGESLPLLRLEGHVQARPAPESERVHVIVFTIGGKDVGLVAPRLCEIREETTHIDTVTLAEPGILGSHIVGEHAVRFVDVVAVAKRARPEWFRGTDAVRAAEERPLVLLAEDSGFFRNQVKSFLESHGLEVRAFEDGLAAWNGLQDPEATYRMVVTDIEMPNMNGLELAREIRRDPMFAHLPIIALTSLAGEDDVRRGREAGIDEYQVKMDRDQLLAAIDRILKARRAAGGLPTRAPQGATA